MPASHGIPLGGFQVVSTTPSSISLVQQSPTTGAENNELFNYELTLASSSSVRLRCWSKSRGIPLQNNTLPETELQQNVFWSLSEGESGWKVDETAKFVTWSMANGVSGRLDYRSTPWITLTDSQGRVIHGDVPDVSLSLLPGGGISWMSAMKLHDIYMGLGEKAAPVSLTRRRFHIATTNAALYDSYLSDPLYKHLPFLIILPNPNETHLSESVTTADKEGDKFPPPYISSHYHPTNAEALYDLGCLHNDPMGDFKSFHQLKGGLEVYVGWKNSSPEVITEWTHLLGKGRWGQLVPRQMLGYLGSTMGQAESEDPPAQTVLAEFPKLCRKFGIPCSAMNLSSGYTVGPKTGFRMTFNWNKIRYPDFPQLMRDYHKDGLKIVANIKPYVSHQHPHFPELRDKDALFNDNKGSFSTTQVWSGLWNENSGGSWVDFTSEAGRDWWYRGVTDLNKNGVDYCWNDDNEFCVADDTHTCKWEVPQDFSNPGDRSSRKQVGVVGKIINCELMGKVSHDATAANAPGRRVYILTRSANVGTLKYAGSSWSGDNYTSWKTLRGSVAIGLNAGVGFMHSYGDDVGGFGGPLPSVELFLRWVQVACFRPRFCIHSFKPVAGDMRGTRLVNEPWMYPEILPHIRNAIRRRYELIPYLYALSWESAEEGKAPNVWPGWGEFERDPGCYTEEVLEGQDFWLGGGKMFICGAFWPGVSSRQVYLPSAAKTSSVDPGYFDIHSGEYYQAGTTVTVQLPFAHIATFVRALSAIPIGKPVVTVTATSGIPRTTADGTEIQLVSEGGVVDVDDFRGVEIFPVPAGSADIGKGAWEWNEDDGESELTNLKVSRVRVEYFVAGDEVQVDASWVKHDFETMWTELWVVLPKADNRVITGGRKEEIRGRIGYFIPIRL